jgi:uncharacterized membrane protein YidH (DUF202 family)
MILLLVILIAVSGAFTLFALLRGLTAFSQEQTTESRTKQTQMMFSRVKWQAIAVILVVVAAAVFSN